METKHNPYNSEYPEHITRYKGPQVPGTGRGYGRTFTPDPSEFEEQKCKCGCQRVLTDTDDYQMNQGFYDRKHKILHKKNIERKSLGLPLRSP